MPHLIPLVSIPAGEDASGLAEMIGGLVEANLADSTARVRVARLARSPVVLRTTDRDATVTFGGDRITITDGETVPGAPSLAGPWLELAHVCTGTRSPIAAVFAGDLAVSPRWRPDLVAIAGFVLSAPSEPAVAAARWRRAALVVAVAAVAVVVIRSSDRKGRP